MAMFMSVGTLQEKLLQLCGRAGILPVKLQLHNGDIVDVKDVRFVGINGGEIHLLAGPSEDDE